MPREWGTKDQSRNLKRWPGASKRRALVRRLHKEHPEWSHQRLADEVGYTHRSSVGPALRGPRDA